MSKKKRKKHDFSVGVRYAREQSKGKAYGYLNLPKGTNIYKPKPDSVVKIDILPYEVTDKRHPFRNEELDVALVGDKWLFRPFKIHRNVGADNESIVCPKSIGKNCPICEERRKLYANDPKDPLIKNVRSSDRTLFALIPRNDADHEETVHIWDISDYSFRDRLDKTLNNDEKYETYGNVHNGYTLEVTLDEESLGKNKFSKASHIEFKSRKQEITDENLDDVPKLDDMLIIPTYEEVYDKFMQIDEEEKEKKEEEEESDVPSNRKKKKLKKDKKNKKKKKDKKDKKNKCPHGYKFGVDGDTKKECGKCKLWDSCTELMDRKNKE